MSVDNNMYTIKDVSKQLKVPVGTLKKWENTFAKFVQIHRTKSGSRIFHDHELNILKKIKLMKDKNMSDDLIKFILGSDDQKENEIPEQVANEYDLKYSEIVALQTETVQAVQNISESFEQLKDEFKKDADQANEQLKLEVKKEIIKGNGITEGMVQTYSQEVLDTYSKTYKQLKQMNQNIKRDQEENLFLQKKIEEREELFQEFVQSYRQSAAAQEERKLSKKIFNWFTSVIDSRKYT